MKKTLPLACALVILSVIAQVALSRRQTAQTPALAEGAFVALGGLRSIAAEVIWFRADRLQDEGRYVELAQLASALTAMEPHTSEVWSYAAWNLAYNVSIMMATPEDRWRWVEAAVRLLRDEGLKLNPGNPDLCRDLAWLFELKLGADIDSAAGTYRKLWREKVEGIATRGAWDELKMDRAKMKEIERRLGFDDWGDPCLSAIYWALEGLPQARGREESMLREIIRQSAVIYRKRH